MSSWCSPENICAPQVLPPISAARYATVSTQEPFLGIRIRCSFLLVCGGKQRPKPKPCSFQRFSGHCKRNWDGWSCTRVYQTLGLCFVFWSFHTWTYVQITIGGAVQEIACSKNFPATRQRGIIGAALWNCSLEPWGVVSFFVSVLHATVIYMVLL